MRMRPVGDHNFQQRPWRCGRCDHILLSSGNLFLAVTTISKSAPPQPNLRLERYPSRRLVAAPAQRRQRLSRYLIDPRDALMVRCGTGLTPPLTLQLLPPQEATSARAIFVG
jgi:hypothetical protein